jgi:hypothetical protein
MPPAGVAALLYSTRQQGSVAAITLAFEAGCELHEAVCWQTLQKKLVGDATSVAFQ